jgi:hypothetical protein
VPEAMARRCITLVCQLIRKGRSVLCLTILATQKTTGDSIPTALRDNSALAVSFALKTNGSSVAALGDAIREYQGYSPTLLREMPQGVGQARTFLPTSSESGCCSSRTFISVLERTASSSSTSQSGTRFSRASEATSKDRPPGQLAVPNGTRCTLEGLAELGC